MPEAEGSAPVEGQTPPVEGKGSTQVAAGSIPERPAYIQEKFWDATAGTVRTETLATSYSELEKKLSGGRDALREEVQTEIKTAMREGVPESADAYVIPDAKTLALADDVDVQFLADHPMLKRFKEISFEKGIGQEQFNEMVKLYVDDQLAGSNPVEELKKLGETGPQRMDNLRTTIASRLTPEEVAGLEPALIDAASFTALEKLLTSAGALKPVESVPGGGSATPSGDISARRAAIEEKMQDPRYWQSGKRDNAFVAEVQREWQALVPGKRRVG